MDLSRVDHLVCATPDLDAGIDAIEHLLGVRASPGGRHPAWGTRNALVSLGASTYLEIIGPDPDLPPPDGPRPFGIDGLTVPRLVTWAANGTDLGRLSARAAGIPIGEMKAGSRMRSDGVQLSWTLTDLFAVVADGVVPFFIDWGDTPHPAASAVSGGRLVALRGEHPEGDRVRQALQRLGLDLPVTPGPTPSLVVTIETATGPVDLAGGGSSRA